MDGSPVEVVKDVGEDEVEERPELCQVVLQRGPREQQTVGCVVRLEGSVSVSVCVCVCACVCGQ